jgi:hypothetical protein
VDADAALSGYADCIDKAEITRESYLSAFQFGDAFRCHLNKTNSTKGYNGPCWSPWLWFDIDREDLGAATRDTRRLASFLCDRYRLDGDSLLIFYSGSKGYHVGIPTSLWNPPLSADFNKLARRFAEHACESINVALDSGIYDKLRALRAPNSRHPKTGRHKRRIGFDELLHLKTSAITELAAEPHPFDLPIPPAQDRQAVIDWQAASQHIAQKTDALRQRRLLLNGSPTLNRRTLEFIREGAPTGDRHRLLYSAAANLAEFGCPSRLAHALLEEAGLDSGLPPQEVRRQIECGLSSTGSEWTHQDATGRSQATSCDPTDLQTEKRCMVDPVESEQQSCQQMAGATK